MAAQRICTPDRPFGAAAHKGQWLQDVFKPEVVLLRPENGVIVSREEFFGGPTFGLRQRGNLMFYRAYLIVI